MKKASSILFFLLTIANLSFSQSRKTDHYEFKGKVEGVKDTTCMLAYYFGDKQFAKDTADIDSQGNFVFKGKDQLLHGMYMIVFPDGKYMEMVVAENEFSFSANNENFIESMVFANSKENQKFYGYMQHIGNQQKILNDLNTQKETATESEKKSIQNKIEVTTKKLIDFQNNFTEENPDILFSSILKSSKDIEIPNAPILENGKIDSSFQYRYYKSHFFDNFDFSDERLLRTPIFHNKISTYLEKLTFKQADSIIVSCDYLIEQSRANSEVFQYTLSYLASTYERSKVMGLEKVFVHLVNKYFKTDVDWLDEVQIFNITNRAETIEPLMIGKIAPNLSLRDSNDVIQVLQNMSNEFTLLIFYDPDCGHCKKEIPVIKQKQNEWSEDGIDVGVYCVSVELDREKWIEFINTYDIGSWINVAELKTIQDGVYNKGKDPNVTSLPEIKEVYDIAGTPKVYLLDKNKRILVNAIKGSIGVEQLSELIYMEAGK
jgi:thiol-disulfide isomerase/thioredoxin